MDEASVVNRMKKQESKARTVQRQAAAAAAAELEKEAEQQRAELRKKRADEPMCLRRQLGSERIAGKAAARAAAAEAAAPAVAAEPKQGTLQSFFLKKG